MMSDVNKAKTSTTPLPWTIPPLKLMHGCTVCFKKTFPTFFIVTWKNYQILIIFGVNIPTQLALIFLLHPMSTSVLPRVSRPSKICV